MHPARNIRASGSSRRERELQWEAERVLMTPARAAAMSPPRRPRAAAKIRRRQAKICGLAFDSGRRSPLLDAVMPRVWAGLPILVFGLLSGAASTAATQSRSSLSWVREPGAESCIGAAELGRRVESLVGPMLVSAPDGEVSVEGRIAPAKPGFVAHVVIAGGHGAILGRRQLVSEAEDCHAIDDKLAFVIAVAIDPNTAIAELPGELSEEEDPGAALLADLRANPARPPPAPSAPARPAAAAQPRAVASPADAPVQWRAAFEPGLGFGNLPDPGVGAALGVGIQVDGLPFWLRLLAYLPQARDAPANSDVRVMTFGLSAAVCPLGLGSRGWEARVCPGLAADLLLASPVGFSGTDRQRFVVGPDLELCAGVSLGATSWLGLSGALSTRFPRQRLGYDLDDGFRTVYRTPVVSGRAGAVLELRF